MRSGSGRRIKALLAAAALLGMVFAQEFVPTWSGFHTWQYACVIGFLSLSIVKYINFARKAGDGEEGGRSAIALIGALLAAGAGTASGLLGPDTVTLMSEPGTVMPLPDLNAAAFFPNADAEDIARGNIALLLRRRGGESLSLSHDGKRFLGSYLLQLRPQHAVSLEVRDGRGRRVTVTRPRGSTFLSPVLLFPSTVHIEARQLPADFFAVPALHRQVEAMYFSPEAVRGMRAGREANGRAAVLFAVEDEAGHLLPGGVALDLSAEEIGVAGLRIRATAGSYPSLVISAVPAPVALWVGSGWCVLGALWILGVRKTPTK